MRDSEVELCGPPPQLNARLNTELHVTVRADNRDAALARYSSGQADVFSGTHDGESDYITRAPANRILPESFLDVPHAIALPKEPAAGLAVVAAFLRDAKGSGLVADAIGRAGLASERVAP